MTHYEGERMRNALGTTNKEEPFKEGDCIEMFDDQFLVLKNYGTRGKVRLLHTHLVIDPFYWEYQGMQAKRVERDVA